MPVSLLPSFLLTFREGLEAALVVVIVASYLKRTGRQNLNRYLYSGAIIAVGASLLIGLTVSALYGELTGASIEIFEGIAALTATVVLTYMILWMTRHAQTLRSELEQRLETAVTSGQVLGVAAISFVAVFREGLETVLFLTTLAIIDSFGTLAGAVAASLLVAIAGAFVMRGVHRLDINRFFQFTSTVSILFAAGLAGYGVHELIEAGESLGMEVGILARPAFDINPPLNVDGTYPLLHEKGAVGSVLAGLVGYDGNPEWMRVIVYVGYWLVLGTYVLLSHRRMKSAHIAHIHRDAAQP